MQDSSDSSIGVGLETSRKYILAAATRKAEEQGSLPVLPRLPSWLLVWLTAKKKKKASCLATLSILVKPVGCQAWAVAKLFPYSATAFKLTRKMHKKFAMSACKKAKRDDNDEAETNRKKKGSKLKWFSYLARLCLTIVIQSTFF
jgi:hypothetical protein